MSLLIGNRVERFENSVHRLYIMCHEIDLTLRRSALRSHIYVEDAHEDPGLIYRRSKAYETLVSI